MCKYKSIACPLCFMRGTSALPGAGAFGVRPHAYGLGRFVVCLWLALTLLETRKKKWLPRELLAWLAHHQSVFQGSWDQRRLNRVAVSVAPPATVAAATRDWARPGKFAYVFVAGLDLLGVSPHVHTGQGTTMYCTSALRGVVSFLASARCKFVAGALFGKLQGSGA